MTTQHSSYFATFCSLTAISHFAMQSIPVREQCIETCVVNKTFCFELAEEIPYHHLSHHKLGRLLWLIRRNPRRIAVSGVEDIQFLPMMTEMLLGYPMCHSLLLTTPQEDRLDSESGHFNEQAFQISLMDSCFPPVFIFCLMK